MNIRLRTSWARNILFANMSARIKPWEQTASNPRTTQHAVVTFRRIVDRRDHAGFITGIVYHAYERTGQSVFDGQIPPNGDEAGHIRTIVRTKYREQRFAVHAYIPFILQSGQYCMEMVDVILFSGISLFQ